MQNFKNAKFTFLIFVLFTLIIFSAACQIKQTSAKPERRFLSKNDFSNQIKKETPVENEFEKVVANENDFSKAAKQNNILQYSLKWTFGRKPQSGWYLYVPLIQETLKTEAAPQTSEFAGRISEWQKRSNIATDGVLNSKTLYSFIEYWQSRRIRPIVLATEGDLLTAPISNFYDPTRDVELLKVEKETFAAYNKMIEAAKSDKFLNLRFDNNGEFSREELFLKMISTYRSPEYQAGLRKQQPNAGRGQLAFRSPHFTGKALDIYVGGEPVTTKDFNRAIQIKTPAYKWLVKNAEKFGFYPYFFEPWHWEYVPENMNN